MNSSFPLKNAGGFEQWRRAITERAAQLLTDHLLETEDDTAPDPSLRIQRPECLKDDANTQQIALWEARERQYIVIHNRVQQLLEYMTQTLEPTLYERVITTNNLSKRTPTLLYRAVKTTLNPSSKSAEIDLQTKLTRLEQTSKTTDIDVWLNSWIQIENIAKDCKYTWASDIIDRFHPALGRRSLFFATVFAAHIWMGVISLSQLAEQYRLCEAKLKRFQYIDAQEVQSIFNPPVSLAAFNNTHIPKENSNEKNEKSEKCPCGLKNHSINKCYLFNVEARPKKWVDRRSIASKKRLYSLLKDIDKRKDLERRLGHHIPRELFEKPIEEVSSAVDISDDASLYENYLTEFSPTCNQSPQSSYMLALATSQTSLPYRDWWVFDSGSGRHICHNKELFWTLKPTKSSQVILTGAGNCHVEGIGSVLLEITTPKGPDKLKIDGVLYVPKFMVNIVSIDRIKDQMLIWDHSENWLTNWDALRTPIARIWNQYNQNFISKKAIYPDQTKIVTDIPETISVDMILAESVLANKISSLRKVSSADVVIWHRRFGHPAPNTVERLKSAVMGAKITGSFDGICQGCLLAKSKRKVSRIPVAKGEYL